jgi:hypothetical protein
MSTTYTTRGSLRGCCGHNHRTMTAAVRCLLSDQSGCRNHAGYSDRVIRVTDCGDERALTNDEHHDFLDAEHLLSQ